jgi:hypothetical protein
MKKYIIPWICIAFFALFTIPGYGNDTPDYAPERTAVIVNGVVITEGEINYELERLEEQAMIQGEQKEIPLNYAYFEELRAQVIEMLIVKELLIDECRKRNIKIAQKLVNEQFDTLKGQFPSEQNFQDFLDYSGISEEKLRSEIEISLSIDTLAGTLIGNRTFSNPEIKEQALSGLIDKLYKRANIIYPE